MLERLLKTMAMVVWIGPTLLHYPELPLDIVNLPKGLSLGGSKDCSNLIVQNRSEAPTGGRN